MSAEGQSRPGREALYGDETLHGDETLCADVGASNVRVGLADGGRVARLAERRIQDLLVEHPDDIVVAIAEMIAAMKALLPAGAAAAGPVGIGVPAIVSEDGSLRVGLRSGIPGGPALRQRLSQHLGTEVVVDNDASLAALGEAIFGAGQGERHIALLTLGTNIGMGVVVDERVYRGARGAAGEIGTVPVWLAPSDALRWELI